MGKISNQLQEIISKMLVSLRGLPLSTVIEVISNKKVIPFDYNDKQDIKVLGILKKVSDNVMVEVNKKGILRSRPNEVGNYIEPFVKRALQKLKYQAYTPLAISVRKKAAGYPDIVI